MEAKTIKQQEKERSQKLFWNAPRYYDYPDGQDLVGKLKFINKYAGLVGSFLGVTLIHTARPEPVSFREKFLKFSQGVLPCITAASAFTCVTYFSTNIRKKDDQLNYVLGGLAAGFVLIPFTGNLSFGVSAALLFSLTGFLKKGLDMEGLPFFVHPVLRSKSPYYERNLDTSLEPDTRRGNWTK